MERSKTARLLEIAAKVRQVPRFFKEEERNLFWDGRVAFGRLIVEAHQAGAWHREGSTIGDKLRLTLISTNRDRPFWTEGKTVPAWLVEAASAVIDTLTEHLVPPDRRGKADVEWEAGILAGEIEREASCSDKQERPENETGAAEWQSPEIPGVPDPEAKIVLDLKGNSRALLLHMWKRDNVTLDELRAVLHGVRKQKEANADAPNDRAVRAAVEQLELKLSAVGLLRTKIVKNGGLYCLSHPQK
jgi:hypothetical protein